MIFLRTFCFLTLAWTAALFDQGIAPLLALGDCAPSGCLLAAAICSLLGESDYRFLVASGFGLVADAASSGPLGIAMGCFALVAFAMVRVRSQRDEQRFLGRSVLLVAGVVGMALLSAVVQRSLGASPSTWSASLARALGVGIYTAVCGLPLLACLMCLRHREG